MPSQLFPPSIVAKAQQRARAKQALTVKQTIPLSAPWEGLTADVPAIAPDLRLVKDTVGLVAKASPTGGGEVLMNDVGFAQLDSKNSDDEDLPLGSADGRVVVHINEFPLVLTSTLEPGSDKDLQAIILVAGDKSTAGSFRMYQMEPGSANWDDIAWLTPTLAGATEPAAGRDGALDGAQPVKSMPDSCIYFGGSTGRSELGTMGGATDQPVFIWTNNVDPVMIYPADNTTDPAPYQHLTDKLGGSEDTCDFRCISVEAWKDRVYYFNTSEGSGTNVNIRHRQRLRRSRRFSCEPDPAATGAGFIDMETFAGAGLRVEGLGDTLVCYFQDGIAFVHETGQVTAPNAQQVINTHRGLLGTHAMTAIGDQNHFLIADDGWWFLDASGRFQEAGVVSLDGKAIEKWRRTFDQLVDLNNLHRLHCSYDEDRNWVRIVVPEPTVSGEDRETTKTWIYDIDGNRVWTLDYPGSLPNEGGVTVWGTMTLRDDTATAWSDMTDTWASIDPNLSWDDLAPDAGTKALVHGNHTGYIYNHSEDLIQYDGVDPPWSYSVVPSTLGNTRGLKTIDHIAVEHINSANDSAINISATSGKAAATEVGSDSLNKHDSGDTEIAKAHFRVTDERVGFDISGVGPVRIRSIEMDTQTRADVRRRD